MAKTPDYTQLSVSGLPDEARTWAKDWVSALNKFLAQTVSALRAIPTPPQLKELTVITPAAVADSFPIDFPNPLESEPTAVFLGKISNSTNTTMTSAVSVHWTWLASGEIRILYISGLAVSSTYDVRLVIQ